MITDVLNKIKTFLKENQKDLFLSAMVFFVGVTSFGLGRLSAIWPEKQPIRIDEPVGNDAGGEVLPTSSYITGSDSSSPTHSSAQGAYVASTKGSAYHLPTCPGAKQIKEENKIWFQTQEAAQRAGYKPAGNCPGL